MAKFVLRFALFALLAALIYGGWAGALVYAELHAYARESKMPPDMRVAVCGDSQTEVGLLPHVWPGFFNFSISSLQLDQVELKVVDLLERNPDFKGVVLLDVSPMKLFAQDIDKSMLEDRSAGKRFLLHALHRDKSRRPLDGIVLLFRDSILVKRTTKAFKSFRLGVPYVSSIGGMGGVAGLTEEQARKNREKFLKAPTQRGFAEHPDLVAEGMEEAAAELNRWPCVDEDSKSVRCLRDIISYIRGNGATPVLITTPVHPKLLAKFPPEKLANFREQTKRLSESTKTPWFSYLEMPLTDDDWRDGNHLNFHGAVKLTDAVRRDVSLNTGLRTLSRQDR